MSEDLLAKEKEFHRLNRELGEKTKDLMKEVDSVLISHSTNLFSCRCDNIVSAFDFCHSDSTILQGKKSFKEITSIDAKSSDKQITEGNTDLEKNKADDIASGEGENLKGDAFLRFLKSKIKLLQEELQTFRLEYKKKCNYCKELEIENKKSEDAKVKFHNQISLLKETITKLEGNNANIQSEIQAREIENTTLKKEIDGLKKELKTVNQQSSNFDIRLNRSLEENERLRNVIKFNKNQEKELREQIRKMQECERITIKNLERQRSEILQAFKKQMCLIDNLKKQKVVLEASKRVQLTEEEFSRILDWGLENT